MSIIANTYTGYAAKGIREDLANVIHNIDPEDTPFMSNVSKGSMKTTFTEWQQDSLKTPVSTNAQLEGDDITSFPAATPTIRVGNYAQIARALVIISDTLEVVDKAGRKGELAYQLAINGASVKRDMETGLLANQPADGGSTVAARKTAGMLAWVKTNVDKEATGVNPIYTNLPNNARTDSGSPRAFTEAQFKTVVRLMWDNGGTPKILMVGSANKQLVSATFTGIATRTLQLTSAQVTAVIGAVDVYVSDFGKIAVVPNRLQRARDAWVLDPSGISVLYLRPFSTVALGKTGDAEKRMIRVEYCLKVNHEKQQGLVADLT